MASSRTPSLVQTPKCATGARSSLSWSFPTALPYHAFLIVDTSCRTACSLEKRFDDARLPCTGDPTLKLVSQFNILVKPFLKLARDAFAIIACAGAVICLTTVPKSCCTRQRPAIHRLCMVARSIDEVGFPLRDIRRNLRKKAVSTCEFRITLVGLDDCKQSCDRG